MKKSLLHNIGIMACVAMIISCFLPWTYYPVVNETFTGFHVVRFATGNFYGKAGYAIVALTLIIFMLMLIPKIWAKRLNLFVAALLVAYTIRTFIIFTAGLVAGDVVKKPGIYAIIACSLLIMIGTLFPNQPVVSTKKN